MSEQIYTLTARHNFGFVTVTNSIAAESLAEAKQQFIYLHGPFYTFTDDEDEKPSKPSKVPALPVEVWSERRDADFMSVTRSLCGG